MKRQLFTAAILVVVLVLAMANIASADIFGTGANQFTIDFVNISGDSGDLGSWSAGSRYTFSGVNHGDYRMGKFEITNDQWNKFKNEYGTVTGSPSYAYNESPRFTGTDVPTNELSWYEGAQFVNYLNTSTGHQAAYKFTGTQGTGNYTFALWQPEDLGYDSDNPYRNSEAFYFMPTEDEWVKAAYWNGTSIQPYATIDGLIPTAGDDTNYDYAVGHQPWDVGSGSEELNGTFDMMGNVWEWLESPYRSGDYLSGSDRGYRGGAYGPADYLISSLRSGSYPFFQGYGVGIRIASVPEPTYSPVADAGDDITVYAGYEGTAVVKLDGSGSFDADGDLLEYFWFDDANELIAEGVDPNVVFAAGVHVIELVVDDGELSSEPNSVVVTVIEAIEAVAYVFPRVLNTTSRGRYVIARMELPDGVTKDDVAEDSLRLIIGDTVIESIRQRRISSRGQDYVFGFFDRGRVIAQADGKTKLDIVIAGELTTGQCVYGEDSIKIVKSQAPQKQTLRRMPVRNSRGGR